MSIITTGSSIEEEAPPEYQTYEVTDELSLRTTEGMACTLK